MAVVQVSVVPVGTGTPSVSSYVACAVAVLANQKELKYQITPMGTVIEGDLDKVLGVIQKMHQSVFGENIQRVLTTVIIDDRRDKMSTMESKVSAVKKKLQDGSYQMKSEAISRAILAGGKDGD